MRLHSPRCRVLIATALLTGLLAGCGAAVDGTPSATSGPETTATSAPTTSAAPTTTDAATPGPTADRTPPPAPSKAAPATKDSGPVTLLPWPTANPARLQAAVDGGAQPWLLDPSDLADSYVSATYSWSAAESTTKPGGTSAATTVDVRNTDGARRTLTVAQPGRKGAGGIWLVTADTKA